MVAGLEVVVQQRIRGGQGSRGGPGSRGGRAKGRTASVDHEVSMSSTNGNNNIKTIAIRT